MSIPLPAPMRRALELAREAGMMGEVPVGAVITRAGETVAEAANAMRASNDPTAHAEILAIRAAASKIGNQRLESCDLWVTLEPCAMCAGAISHARIGRLYYAAADPKSGGVEHGARVFAHRTCHHRPQLFPGIGESDAAMLLREFFVQRREAC